MCMNERSAWALNPRSFSEQRRKEEAYMRRIGTRAYMTSLLAIFAMLLVACGGGPSTTTGGGNTPAAPKAEVALVTHNGGPKTKGFNHPPYTGPTKYEAPEEFRE